MAFIKGNRRLSSRDPHLLQEVTDVYSFSSLAPLFCLPDPFRTISLVANLAGRHVSHRHCGRALPVLQRRNVGSHGWKILEALQQRDEFFPRAAEGTIAVKATLSAAALS